METRRQHWCEKYLGRKWDQATYNCWHFVADVYRQELSKPLPIYAITGDETLKAARKIRDEIDLGAWKQVANPVEFDAVAMGKGSQITHVGVWTEADGGKIIHNNQGHGVIAMNLQQAKIHGYGILKFYRHADNR